MGFSDDFVAERIGALSESAKSDAEWSSFRQRVDAGIQARIRLALEEMVRGLTKAGVAPITLVVVTGGQTEEHHAWMFDRTRRSNRIWITENADVLEADFRRVSRDDHGNWFVNADDVPSYAFFQPSAFVVSAAGQLIAFLEDSEYSVTWKAFDSWLVEQMRAMARLSGYTSDHFPTAITEPYRAAAFELAKSKRTID